jgi:hypothetical protein
VVDFALPPLMAGAFGALAVIHRPADHRVRRVYASARKTFTRSAMLNSGSASVIAGTSGPQYDVWSSLMNIQRAVGIALLVVGVVLFIVGMNASNSVADRWSNFFTGHFTDATLWYIVGGLTLAVVGLVLAMFGRRAI